MDRAIRILIAEDSVLVQKLLAKILDDDPELEVVGVAKNGRIAVELSKRLRPDVITMDIRMPVMDGFEATRIIMSENPTPILVVSSSVGAEDLKISFNAIQAGALDIMEKPKGQLTKDYLEISQELIRKIKLIAGIRVFRHLSPRYHHAGRILASPVPKTRSKAVAIGASTGGPSALFQLITSFGDDFPSPVFVTQHISEGFGMGCVDWINRNAKITVKIGEDGEHIQPGVVYFAPDNNMMTVISRNFISINEEKMGKRSAPINSMMESFAEVYGPNSVGVLLTGMGDDGALGMKKIKDFGGRTIVQDEKTSVVFGMPKAAMDLGAADEVLPLKKIGEKIISFLSIEE